MLESLAKLSNILDLILTLATQLYSKITKINEISVVTPHFYLKLVQKLIKKKSSSFRVPRWLHTKTNSCHLSHLNKLSGLHLMSLMHKKEFRGIISPATSSQEQFFSKNNFSHLHLIAKRCAVAQLWSCDPDIIILIQSKFYSRWRVLVEHPKLSIKRRISG